MHSPSGQTLFFISLIVNIISILALSCSQSLARTVPTNYIILGVFTLTESVMVGYLCSHSKPELVLMALFMTISMCLGLMLYAMTTETDFTMSGGLLFVAGLTMLAVGIMVSFTHNKTAHVIYSALSVILLGVYLIYDIQLLVGNKTNSLSYDDYILGSVMIYTDIVGIFIHILQILNSSE